MFAAIVFSFYTQLLVSFRSKVCNSYIFGNFLALYFVIVIIFNPGSSCLINRILIYLINQYPLMDSIINK